MYRLGCHTQYWIALNKTRRASAWSTVREALGVIVLAGARCTLPMCIENDIPDYRTCAFRLASYSSWTLFNSALTYLTRTRGSERMHTHKRVRRTNVNPALTPTPNRSHNARPMEYFYRVSIRLFPLFKRVFSAANVHIMSLISIMEARNDIFGEFNPDP